MEFEEIRPLRGANIWTRVPVLQVDLDLTGLPAETSDQYPGFADRLLSWLPTLTRRVVDPSSKEFSHRLRQGVHLATALQYVILELQSLGGSNVDFGHVRPQDRAGHFLLVVEYEEEELGQHCLALARELCLAALHNQPFDIKARLHELRERAYDIRLGPSTAAIVRAARRRGIPVRRLNQGSLVQLGHGTRQRRICTAETDRTSAIAEAVAQDKQLTRSLLRAVGVPVPDGRPVESADDAWEAAEDIGLPVVVKPQYGNHGRGVATNLTTRDQVVRAYAAAREEGPSVLVERYIPGVDYRLLVIGDRLVAAALREPAHVIGDGNSTIIQLIAQANTDPRRSDGHATALSYIKLDPVALGVLAEQGYTPEAIPPAGVRVLIRRNGNLSTGGTATDVTDHVHPDVAARAVEAAHVVGLDIAGVDVVATGISRPLAEQGAVVVEVNAGPGLRMHLEPSAGQPRPVGEAVVSMLFPDGETGRIPLVAVTGVNGKTTTTRLIAHLLRATGHVVGMACTDGIFVNDRRLRHNDCSGPRSARAVLANPQVEAAVLETARGGILRQGLGFDYCDVAVVTNIGKGDHLGPYGVATPEDLARVKRVVVEIVAPSGTAVLNAAEPLVVAMAPYCPGRILYFGRDPNLPVLIEHRRVGGRTVFVRNGVVVRAEGEQEEALVSLDEVPATHGGQIGFQVENVLTAVGAAWALDLPAEKIRAGLASFVGDPRQTPGRFNVFRRNGVTVILDYAHNTSAFAALVEALPAIPHQRRSIVFQGCRRHDADHIGMGEVVGSNFDRVILCTDGDQEPSLREYEARFRRGLAAGRRMSQTVEVRGERAGIELALQDLQPGDLLVLGVDAIEESLSLIESRLAE
jgi:cyanophycin synthetase